MSDAEPRWWIATVNEDGQVEHVEAIPTEPDHGEHWTTRTTHGTHWKAVGSTREEASKRAKEYWSRRVAIE